MNQQHSIAERQPLLSWARLTVKSDFTHHLLVLDDEHGGKAWAETKRNSFSSRLESRFSLITLSPWRQSPHRGQTAAGHLWASCNAKPSAERHIISCCVYVFPSNGDVMACFPMGPALNEAGACARGAISVWAPGSALLEDGAWTRRRGAQRPLCDTPHFLYRRACQERVLTLMSLLSDRQA